MLPGKKRPEKGESADRRLRSRVANLFLSNTLSAEETSELARDARDSGVSSLRRLAEIGERRQDGHTRPRDIRRHLSKNSHWPPPYKFEAPVWDKQNQRQETTTLTCLLPHEVLYVMNEKSPEGGGLTDLAHLQESEFQRHARAAADMGVAPESLAGLGIWGDGVPMTRNRNQSLEMLSFNILTCQIRSTMRIPVFVIQKHWLAHGGSTWNAVMDVLRWSLTCATSGQMPKYDHTGQPLKEPWRKSRALIHTPRGVLLEIRGDWAFFKQVLYMPAWCLGCI